MVTFKDHQDLPRYDFIPVTNTSVNIKFKTKTGQFVLFKALKTHSKDFADKIDA